VYSAKQLGAKMVSGIGSMKLVMTTNHTTIKISLVCVRTTVTATITSLCRYAVTAATVAARTLAVVAAEYSTNRQC